MRISELERKTKETDIKINLNLDGTGESNIETEIGFLDHMLTLFAFHSGIDINVKCNGDLNVDGHHTVEDLGILLGKSINQALSDKKGIMRYADCFMPMDETLAHFSLDISGRPYLVFNVSLSSERVGTFETELTEEFFRAVAMNLMATMHINLEYGKNTHHIIEAIFKAFGRCIKQAVKIDKDNPNKILSSKGIL